MHKCIRHLYQRGVLHKKNYVNKSCIYLNKRFNQAKDSFIYMILLHKKEFV